MKATSRWLVLVLCLALFAVMFVGCGPAAQNPTATPDNPQNTESAATPVPTEDATPEPQGPKYMKAGETYRVLRWDVTVENWPLTQDGVRGELANQQYNEMKEKYGVTPLWVVAPGDWLGETMNSTYAGDPITDVFHFGGPFTLPQLYTHGGEQGAILVPISDYPDIDFSDPEYWNLSAQSVGNFNGKQYTITPNYLGFDNVQLNNVTIFNKQMLARAGYTAEQLYDWSDAGEWTFDRFREVIKAATDPDTGIYGATTTQNNFLLNVLIAANGSDELAMKDGRWVFNMTERKAMNAINFLIDVMQNDKSILLDTSAEEAKDFAAGKFAMMVACATRVGTFYNKMEDDYGIIMPPKGPDATDYISENNWFDGYLVMKNISNPGGAVEFANLYLRPAYGASAPEQEQLLVAQCQAYRMDDRSIETLKKIPSKNLNTAYMIYWSCSTAGSGNYASLCNYVLAQLVDGSLSPDTYYASIEGTVNAIIEGAMSIQN